MVFLHEGEARNSSLITIKSLQFNINSETSYVSLAQVVAAKLYIYESRGGGSLITSVQLQILSKQPSRALNSM